MATVEEMVKARAKKDDEARDESWKRVGAEMPPELRNDRQAVEMFKRLFDLGWECGLVYMGNNPLPQ